MLGVAHKERDVQIRMSSGCARPVAAWAQDLSWVLAEFPMRMAVQPEVYAWHLGSSAPVSSDVSASVCVL